MAKSPRTPRPPKAPPPAAPAKGGRPSSLTQATQDAITTALRLGNYRETAAASAGVSKVTFYTWIRQGARDRDKGLDTPHSRFLNSLERAEAEGESAAMDRITQAGRSGAWQADAWRLERTRPDRFALTTRVQVEARREIAAFLEHLEKTLPAATYRQILESAASYAVALVPELPGQ